MSTAECPKQFIDVLGVGRSLIQLTYNRFADVVPSKNVWVVTNQKYVGLVHEQLPDIPFNHILSEPCRRNTAPCVAYVSWRIKKENPKANIVVSPSDHIVTDEKEFRRVVGNCLKFTAETDAIVTLGMKPTRPETGYGYIQADLTAASARNREIFRVDQFREKPDLETAERYIRQNNFFWNAGIFIWSASTIINAFRIYQPGVARIFERIMDLLGTDDEQRVIDEVYPECENISVRHHGESRRDIRLSGRLRLERPGHMGVAACTDTARHLRQHGDRQRRTALRQQELHRTYDRREKGRHPRA